MPEFEIKPLSASPEIVTMLSEILVATVANGGSVSFMHPLDPAAARAFWDHALAAAARGERIVFGAWDGAALIGTVSLLLDCPPNQPHRAEIAKMMTRPRCRKRGAATALMRAAEAEAVMRGRTLLTLDTAAEEGASAFYEKLGFILAGTIPDYALKPHGGLTGTMIYWKRIGTGVEQSAARTASDEYAAGAAYVGGRFMPIAQAGISPLDWGFTRSDAVYDVVHVYRGGFFRLDDHLDRFARSMQARRLAIPEDRAAIEAILHRCVALTGLADAYVAMVASRGRPRVFGSRRPADCQNHFLAYAIPWIDAIPADAQARGAHLWIANAPRVADASVDPTVKNYQWSDFTSGLMEAHDNGCDTVVLCDAAGFVTEGPGFNVFVVRDGRVMTPDRGSLQGVTRQSVLDLCAELGVAAEIAPIPRSVLEDADEVFVTSTAGGVMPVARVGARILGNDRPGPLSLRLKAHYWRKHAEGWRRTEVRGDVD